jgi:hypothetical protein
VHTILVSSNLVNRFLILNLMSLIFPPSAKFKNEWSYYSTLSHPLMTCTGTTLALPAITFSFTGLVEKFFVGKYVALLGMSNLMSE